MRFPPPPHPRSRLAFCKREDPGIHYYPDPHTCPSPGDEYHRVSYQSQGGSMVNAIADLLIRYKAIEFGEFTLASGKKSPYYIDVTSAVTNPDLLFAIASTIAQTHTFDVVAGVAVGGVPLAVATAIITKKPLSLIRASEKSHGKKEVIIGNVRDTEVLLVEDVTTSGESALYGINAPVSYTHLTLPTNREV